MGETLRKHLGLLLLFATMSVVMAFPLACVLPDGLPEMDGFANADALQNVWLLSHNAYAVLHHPADILNTNCFYPRRNTLAYFHHMLGLAPVSVPLLVVLRNPVLVYNVMLLSSFVLCGYAAALLLHSMTGSWLGGIFAGVVFAFSSFRMGRVQHLQYLAADPWWAFGVLGVHGFLTHRNWRWGLFAFFSFLVAMGANSYYALFGSAVLSVFVCACAALAWCGGRRAALVCGTIALLACVAVLQVPYLRLRKEMGLKRREADVVEGSADLTDYLAPAPGNKLYGSRLFRRSSWDGGLFPGFLAIIFAAWAKRSKEQRRLYPFAVCLLVAFLLSLGPSIRWCGHPLMPGAHRLIAAVFSPYASARVPAEYGTFVQFFLCVLAGVGLAAWLRTQPASRRVWLGLVVIAAAVAEYACFPMPFVRVPTRDDLPPVYAWLSRQPRSVIAEVPAGTDRLDGYYMYLSVYHRHRMVNGYGGFEPPERGALRVLLNDFPAENSIEAMQWLGVRYVIFHGAVRRPRTDGLPSGVRVLRGFGDDFVFALDGETRKAPAPPYVLLGRALVAKLRASENTKTASLACDGDVNTIWTSAGTQHAGMWFEITLREPATICGIRFHGGRRPGDFPRECRVESVTPRGAKRLAEGSDWVGVLQSCFSHPRDPTCTMRFPAAYVSRLRITVTARKFPYRWSIAELELLGPSRGDGVWPSSGSAY